MPGGETETHGKAAADPHDSADATSSSHAGLPKIKSKQPNQRACDERNENGKLCCGHLKRWYDYPAEIESLIGADAEIYRCEFCRALYKPDLSHPPHSYTLRY